MFSDTMANWDDAQLAEVVEQRHGEENKKKYSTQIVSDKKWILSGIRKELVS
jgi:hypothetical protein